MSGPVCRRKDKNIVFFFRNKGEGVRNCMNKIVIDIPPETHKRLEVQARRKGKTLKALTRELIETALQTSEEAGPKTAQEVLQAAGRIHPLSETLRRKIIPGVTLDEVRTALTQAAGPSLSELILEQRGPKL